MHYTFKSHMQSVEMKRGKSSRIIIVIIKSMVVLSC